MRRVEAEQRFMLTREQVKEALQEIKQWHPELWLAIVLVDVKGMSQGKAADGMGTNPRRVRRLLKAGWAMIAEVIERGQT